MARIGIDIGGTSIKFGIVNDNYGIIASSSCRTNAGRAHKDLLDDIAWHVNKLLRDTGMSTADIDFVGIGSPGTCNTKAGIVEYACNLNFENVPLQKEMEDRLKRPVLIDNDANTAAYGETLAGAARGCDSFILLTLGTGIGSGIVFNGRIYTGCNYAGAELGHIVIVKDGIECGCGRRGCFEQYGSASALIRQTREAMAERRDSLLWRYAPSIDDVNGSTAFLAMKAGDLVAGELIAKYLRYLTCGITNVINIFQPELMCIGGGVSNEGETLLSPLRLFVAEERYSKYSLHQTRLEAAALGNRAGIIGAAFLDRAHT